MLTSVSLVQTTCNPGVSAFPDGDNLFHWVATITGAEGTVYEGLSYKLTLTFPSSYPYSPPVVKFTTPCYHPNVDDQGNICLDILKVSQDSVPLPVVTTSLTVFQEEWSALYDVRTILLSLQSLLGGKQRASCAIYPLTSLLITEPNNSSPLNVEAAELWSDQTGRAHISLWILSPLIFSPSLQHTSVWWYKDTDRTEHTLN